MIGSFKKLMRGVALTLLCTLLTLEAQQVEGTTEPSTKSTFDPPRILAILRPNEAPPTAGTDVNEEGAAAPPGSAEEPCEAPPECVAAHARVRSRAHVTRT